MFVVFVQISLVLNTLTLIPSVRGMLWGFSASIWTCVYHSDSLERFMATTQNINQQNHTGQETEMKCWLTAHLLMRHAAPTLGLNESVNESEVWLQNVTMLRTILKHFLLLDLRWLFIFWRTQFHLLNVKPLENDFFFPFIQEKLTQMKQ